MLNRYAVERLLHRLSCSPHREGFVLKGATLLRVWSTSSIRPTRDLDLLGFGPSDLDDVARRGREICDAPVPDDGITFRGDTIVATRIKDDAEYEGVRVRLQAELAGATIPVQIDVGFGDAAQPREDSYPVMLEDFAGAEMLDALRATFERRARRVAERSWLTRATPLRMDRFRAAPDHRRRSLALAHRDRRVPSRPPTPISHASRRAVHRGRGSAAGRAHARDPHPVSPASRRDAVPGTVVGRQGE
jgi:hypothetical protein